MIEAWLAQAAEAFWDAIGAIPPYPRNLSHVIGRAFHLSPIFLPNLCIRQVEQWLEHRQIAFRFLCQDRSLCGCIVAARGHGLIFVDSLDEEAEQRYTLAHETAHFLLDYLHPRQKALNTFGERILPVLNGDRPPTEGERIDAILSSVRLETYSDLMPRSPHGGLDQSYILRAEQRADRLALELLAPSEQALSELLPLSPQTPDEQLQAAILLLTSTYGLPLSVAKKYSAVLLRPHSRFSMARWLDL